MSSPRPRPRRRRLLSLAAGGASTPSGASAPGTTSSSAASSPAALDGTQPYGAVVDLYGDLAAARDSGVAQLAATAKAAGQPFCTVVGTRPKATR